MSTSSQSPREQAKRRRSGDASGTATAIVPKTTKLLLLIASLVGTVGLIVGSLALAKENNRGGSSNEKSRLNGDRSAASSNTTNVFQSRLDEVHERGFLKCGYFLLHPGFLFVTGTDATTGETQYAGLDYQLCRILSAAIFDGDSEAFELVPLGAVDRWGRLNAGEVDFFARTTHNMGFDVFHPVTETGFHFSSSYLFDPVNLGGIEEHVRCAERFSIEDDAPFCEGLKICIWEGTIFHPLMKSIFPDENLVSVPPTVHPFMPFPNECNVVAGIQSHLTEASFELFGYEGQTYSGAYFYGVEPLCIVTPQGDPIWSDFVEVTLQTLIAAEEKGVTKFTARELPTTNLFGPRFENMFRNIIAVSGNYGEVYVDNVEAFVPRSAMNRINSGSEPRLLSFSLGNVNAEGPQIEVVSPTVQAIRERGYLRCGQFLFTGFSEFDPQERSYSGFQVDLCRAVSAALFDGVDRTQFERISITERFVDLNEGQFDLLLTASWTMPRDVGDASTGNKGLSFAGPFFYLGIAFGGRPPFIDCAERLDVFSPDCQSLRVCSIAGGSFTELFGDILRDHFVVPSTDYDEMVMRLREGECNVMLASLVDVQEELVRAAGYGDDLPYEAGTRQFSIEHLSLTMQQDDPIWNDFVRWVFNALLYAEVRDITQANATLMPRVNLFGPLRTDAFYHAVNMVGNYGEIYERNLGAFLPRSGVHLLNNFTQPRMYAFPGLF